MLRFRHIPFVAFLLMIVSGAAFAGTADEMKQRFDWLSTNGNSTCSATFLQLIPAMLPGARLQGSCCGEMVFANYAQQTEGLKAYAAIPEIPVDPYDIDARAASALLAANAEIILTADEQAVFDYALQHADEGGPCCCRCWRWEVYSGLAKKLIHERGFTGDEMSQVWDLSSGCGS